MEKHGINNNIVIIFLIEAFFSLVQLVN